MLRFSTRNTASKPKKRGIHALTKLGVTPVNCSRQRCEDRKSGSHKLNTQQTVASVDEADWDLNDFFCCGLQAYFGPEACTINIHMHLHLRQCLLDYGPIYGF